MFKKSSHLNSWKVLNLALRQGPWDTKSNVEAELSEVFIYFYFNHEANKQGYIQSADISLCYVIVISHVRARVTACESCNAPTWLSRAIYD